MVEILGHAGIKPKLHRDHFPPEEADHIWIPKCAKEGWLIVTSDQGIETDAVNRLAVFESCAKVFILADGCSRAASWAAAVIISRKRIYQLALHNKGPFYATIHKESGLLVKHLRRPWPKPESPTNETIIVHEPPPNAVEAAAD